jgi:ribonuclease R
MKKRKTRKQGGKKVFPQVTGRAQMTREGFIFVKVEGEEEDIFVKASKTRHALDGDLVKVAVTREKGRTGRREGEVIEILERGRKYFVGYMHYRGAQAWVLMQSKYMPYDIMVDAEEARTMGAQAGMKVAASVDKWDRGSINPYGHLVDVLGFPGENETEMHAILAEFNLPYRFPANVEKEAEAIRDAITEEDLKGRKDFRDSFTFTIDPADAKDFDDALSFRKLGNGDFEVGVHIADVSWYVKPGTALDKEARERGTSVYLVDRTVPMLPEKLSNKVCSLRPGEDKLCFSAIFQLSPKAEIRSRSFSRTIIRSDYRLDYDQAQGIIENSGEGDWSDTLKEAILTLNGLAQRLKEKRFKNGAVNFDRPEMKVEVDASGKPVRVYQKISKEANFLIEEFMLLANRSVAEFIATDGKMNAVAAKNAKTFVYRVHGEPNSEKLQSLKAFAGHFGYKMEGSLEGREAAKTLNTLLESAKGKAESATFEDIALRAMAKAFYSSDNIGHYGLAFPFYTHFTSPIRRYPDTMVHRLLSSYLAGGKSAAADRVEQECKHASEREIVAAEAERTSVKYKLVEFMQDKLGQEFDGRISGITEWGMYVEIEPTKIEGMVPLREIRSDFFDFDEKAWCLRGRRTRKCFRLGDPVRIKVKNANLEQRLLDFELVEAQVGR